MFKTPYYIYFKKNYSLAILIIISGSLVSIVGMNLAHKNQPSAMSFPRKRESSIFNAFLDSSLRWNDI
jgi:hypothetical protein